MNEITEKQQIGGMRSEEVVVHFDELLGRLKIIFISLSITTIVVILLPAKFLEGIFTFDEYSPMITVVLKKVLLFATSLAEERGGSFTFTLGAPYSVIIVCLELGVIIAVILNIPIICYEIYAFIRPALYDEEADFALKLALSFGVLFLFGAIAGALLVPIMVDTLFGLTTIVDYGRIVNFVPLESFVDFIFFSIIGTGVLFTFPIWLVFGALAGAFSSEGLMNRRREILIALIALTAVITPDPTPISMILLSIPLIVFFEIAIVVIMRIEERRGYNERFPALKRITEVWETV
ncbi:MAG: twin-arginine translocase subunit TatC [Candidatus Hodarchaeales archaeon]|jgi:sec-independent protein translocase protein TatC